MGIDKTHIGVLDGWRGISILLVLAAHLLPLGPKSWELNSTAGPAGMALFFTLSGFLITQSLLRSSNITEFLIRRFVRIVPLAWICLFVALIWVDASPQQWLANLFFYANWPPMQLPVVLSPAWSLCVEVQFYVGIAFLVLLLRRYAFFALPFLCVAVTVFRMFNGVHVAINTYYRLDEILAGCLLALMLSKAFSGRNADWLSRLNPFVLVAVFLISCHPASGFFNYFRPYFASMLVGWALLSPQSVISRAICNKFLIYMAAVSFALYMIHPLLAHSWLGSGDTVVKYIKRPLLFFVLFVLAHISTFYFEHRCISWGKDFARKITAKSNLNTQG